jgi:hypothetical protein
MALPDLPPELCRRVDGGIDVATEEALSGGQGTGDLGEGDIADDQHIDIAVAPEFTAGGRAKDEGCPNPAGLRHERLRDDIDDANRLHQERLQLRENRALAVGLEVDVTTLDGAPEDPRVDQELQLALHGTRGGFELPHELAQVEPLVGMTEEPTKEPPPGASKQDGRRFPRDLRGL